jgi:hypothetical protein
MWEEVFALRGRLDHPLTHLGDPCPECEKARKLVPEWDAAMRAKARAERESRRDRYEGVSAMPGSAPGAPLRSGQEPDGEGAQVVGCPVQPPRYLAELAATAGVKTVHTPKEEGARGGVVFAREFPHAPGAERKAAV